jgi:putative ABC transport system permease protein
MRQLIWANLRARPIRSGLSVLAVALQVFLLLFMMGMTNGILTEYRERIGGIGADLLVQQPNASIFLAFSRAVLPESLGEELKKVPGVKVVAPVVAVVNTNGITTIFGIDFDTYNQLGSGFLFHAGGPFERPYDVIVDDIKARSTGLEVGDSVELLNQNFRVVGIVQHGRGARFFIPLRTAQEMLNLDSVSMYWIQTSGDPAAVQERLQALLPRHKITSMSEYMSLLVSENLPELEPFTHSIIAVGLLFTFLVILLSMYTVVLERTREIGILKALGASRWDIVALVVRESVVIALLGALLGIAVSYGTKLIVAELKPTLTILITPDWLLWALLLAVLGCILGSMYPAFRAAAADPVAALAYE